MRIDSSGQVGIGTSSPDAKLMVSESTNDTASALFYNTAGGSGSIQGKGYIGFGISEGWNFHGAEIGWDQESLSGYRQALTFSTRLNSDVRPTERMRIDSSGNLLVGTTSGSDKVTVNGTVNATAFVGDGSALTGVIPTTAGAVGTYANVVHYGDELNFGDTIAGSSVHPVGISKGNDYTYRITSYVAFGSLESALSGTWRVMASGAYSGIRSYSFLALRIS